MPSDVWNFRGYIAVPLEHYAKEVSKTAASHLAKKLKSACRVECACRFV